MRKKSPFPGMAPFLELYWGDVHSKLVTYSTDTIQARLPDDPRARCEQRVLFEEATEEEEYHLRQFVPATFVVEDRPPWLGTDRIPEQIVSGELTATIPRIIRMPDDPMPQHFIQIIDTRDGYRVVTVIEIISPTNKRPGDGRDQYLRKKKECHEAGVNLVEIDLTRAGSRDILAPINGVSARPRPAYEVHVSRATHPQQREIYPISLWERLPTISIPLRPHDNDVPLELQPLIDQVYERGRYDTLNYERTLDPRLTDGARRSLAERMTSR